VQIAIFPCEAIASMPPTFWAEAQKKLRPHALSAVIEFGQYLILWTSVAGAHIVRIITALIGIDPDILVWVAWIEKWTIIASFASFFGRFWIRFYKSAKDVLS